ncbi:hypothetical protein Ancab_023296 [Ancistrocladus abbreviatus]
MSNSFSVSEPEEAAAAAILKPLSISEDDYDDDFQTIPPFLPLTSNLNQPTTPTTKPKASLPLPQPQLPNLSMPRKKRRVKPPSLSPDKENIPQFPLSSQFTSVKNSVSFRQNDSDSDSIAPLAIPTPQFKSYECICPVDDKVGGRSGVVAHSKSIESRLLSFTGLGTGTGGGCGGLVEEDEVVEGFETCTQLDVVMRLCSDTDDLDAGCLAVECPLCGLDISDFSDESRQLHTNDCLDKCDMPKEMEIHANDNRIPENPGQVVEKLSLSSPHQVADVAPVLEWLRRLGLAKYEAAFIKEEIDWDTLQWLTEEDLINIGITALGPRKKIVHALSELRTGSDCPLKMETDGSKPMVDRTKKQAMNRLITEYFSGSMINQEKCFRKSRAQHMIERYQSDSDRKQILAKKHVSLTRRTKEIPLWCCVPGTPFRVDAFKYLTRECSHWFLTHFHADHYQGLTRSFSHGKIYCSMITAKLVNLKMGISWDKLQVLPLNQKICIAGVDVTCFDANHCPGAIIILFQPPNGKAVLHTGDFRFSEEMLNIAALHTCPIHTLILDTTYCDPQYDFPKQDAVVQFVIEAIQAETFNPRTLFLIGCYTIGKERLFLEVARVLRKKVYVTKAKLHALKCLGLTKEDMQWFTVHEQESQIHVVPLWTLASFKRLKQMLNQYADRFSLIVGFSPTGWSFGKGKKSMGRRSQQGTIIRYEVPYSEHSSFTELKHFVKFLSPENIIPSVNNHGRKSSDAMIALLTS